MLTVNRTTIELNGAWKFCPDPMQRCRRQKWWCRPPQRDSCFPCWDPEGLWDIQVPGTWKTQFEELKWYDGHAVYMRDFEADVPPGQEAFLVFDGVVYASEIYLNGQQVGRHDWGYSNFSFRVTDMLRGQNRLFVLVDNTPSDQRVPGEICDWNNDGGIINGVKLVMVPSTFIKNFRTETRLLDDVVEIQVDAWLESRDTSACEDVSVSIPELGLSVVVAARAGERSVVTLRVPRDQITLWSPAQPKLYTTELQTRFETVCDEIGYREIKTMGREILLNGEPLRLYGISVHSEFPKTGRTATLEGIRAMIAKARELGVNFLRCAHYPYAELFGREMDRAGLLWWQEVPAYWLPNMGESGQTEQACGMLRETVQRDWNRAGLIIWSVSNECCWRNPEDTSDNNYAYWFKAVPMVRRLDPSRLVSCAEAGNMISLQPVWDPQSADEFNRPVEDVQSWRPGHADEWYALFDVLAANIYVGTPGEAAVAYPRYVEMFRRYNKPLMLSEFGSMSLRGAQVPDDQLGSEVRHAALLREAYEVFCGLPGLVGWTPWCLNDIRVPIHWRWYNSGQGLFRYGVTDENLQKKVPVFTQLKQSIAELKATFGASQA